jgi:hypothetical protein
MLFFFYKGITMNCAQFEAELFKDSRDERNIEKVLEHANQCEYCNFFLETWLIDEVSRTDPLKKVVEENNRRVRKESFKRNFGFIWEEGLETGNEKREGILLNFYQNGVFVKEQILLAKAGGIAENIPPQIHPPENFLPDSISLSMERNPVDNSLHIGFLGGTATTRSLILITIYYDNGESERVLGKEIGMGAAVLPEEKWKKIYRVRWDYNTKEKI